MKKTLTAALAALTFGGAALAVAAPADAQRYHGGGYYGHGYYGHRGNGGTAVAAGVVGLALGAALASNSNHSYAYNRGGYYDRGYYEPAYGYGYGYAPRTCYTRQLAYDPYIGRDVVMRRAYAC
jgi:hypothetical protein